jgi:hypothetical protein
MPAMKRSRMKKDEQKSNEIKSVSLVGLVNGDKEILNRHAEACEDAAEWFRKNQDLINLRGIKNRPTYWIATIFSVQNIHSGEFDPQMYSHVVSEVRKKNRLELERGGL